MVLAVPNWSFSSDAILRDQFREILRPVKRHYAQGDVDHNRTVTAFSGTPELVLETLLNLCEAAFARIDLREHTGVHPLIGALDVCPFVPCGVEGEAQELAVQAAEAISRRWDVPTFLYERSERGHHASDLPTLRKGGFSALLERELDPDFGPTKAHPTLGATVIGVRSFLIALNVDLDDPSAAVAKQIAREIRHARDAGDGTFSGVRALGFELPSRGESQVSLNLMHPDHVSVDGIVDWIVNRSIDLGVPVMGTELIGVIRAKDVATSRRVNIAPSQILEID